MRTAFPPSDYYADSATPSAHQPASGLAGLPPAARRAQGASHVHHDPFDRVGSWLYPYSPSGGHSQYPAGHHARSNSQARSAPPSKRAASLLSTTQIRQVSGRSRNREASTTRSLSLFLSVSLARTRASGSTARPLHCQGASAAGAQSRALAALSFSGPLHRPGAGIPAGTDEMFDVLHLLSHGASWRTFDFLGFRIQTAPARSDTRRLQLPERAIVPGHQTPHQGAHRPVKHRPLARRTRPLAQPDPSGFDQLPPPRRVQTLLQLPRPLPLVANDAVAAQETPAADLETDQATVLGASMDKP